MGLFSFSFSSSKRRRHGGYGGSYYRSGGYSSFSSSDRWRHGGYGAPHHNSGLGGMIGAAGLGTIVGAGKPGKENPSARTAARIPEQSARSLPRSRAANRCKRMPQLQFNRPCRFEVLPRMRHEASVLFPILQRMRIGSPRRVEVLPQLRHSAIANGHESQTFP